MPRSLPVIVILLFMASVMTGLTPEIGGAEGGTSSEEDRSPQIFRVDDSGGQAFLTIQSAIDAASPGDIVRVYDGTYYENVTIDRGVHLIGNGSAATTITNDGSRDVVTVHANGFSIKGFMIGNSGKKAAAIALDRVHSGVVEDCHIPLKFPGLYGIRGDDGCDNITIRNCNISKARKAGIQLGGTGNRILNCSFAHNKRAISIHGDGSTIEDNTFLGDDYGVDLGYLPMDVLLMGNSYTFANSLDDILEDHLWTITTEPRTSQLAAGGLTLSDHASRASSPGHQWNVTLNDDEPWDAVVLQDQSQIPGFPTSQSSWQRSLEGATTLNGMIEDLGADTVLLMTWGRRDGDSTNPTLYPNFTVMQARLEAGYRMYAENLSTERRPVYIAPVGLAFKEVHDRIAEQGQDPTTPGTVFYNLYTSDGSHPSLSGSYLASCVLFATLTGLTPVDRTDGTILSGSLKRLLWEVADDVVFNLTTAYEYPWRRASDNLVSGNDFHTDSRGLTMMCNAFGNVVTNNSFDAPIGIGVRVMDANNTGNVFHHNGFNDDFWPSHLVYLDASGNIWDDGAEGNYWSDYRERYPDATNDGVVWDMPYNVGGDVDRYPLVRFHAFDDLDPPTADAGPDWTKDEGKKVLFDGDQSHDNVGIVNYTWSFEYDGETVHLYGQYVDFTFEIPGVYNVTLNVTDAVGNWGVDHAIITILDTTWPTGWISPIMGPFDQHDTVTLNGSRSYDNVGVVNWTWMVDYLDRYMKRGQLYGPVVELVVDDAGRYTVHLTVVDAAGNTGTDHQSFTVLDTERPDAAAGPDATIDQGTSHRLDARYSSDNVGIVSYTWTFEEMGTTIDLDGETVYYQFMFPVAYLVTLVVEDDAGNIANDTVAVTVRDALPPVANAGVQVTIMQGGLVTLNALNSTDNVGIVRYLWTFEYDGSPIELEGDVLEFIFEIMGRHYITLTVFDAVGLSSNDTTDVTVFDNFPPVADAGEDRMVDQWVEVILDGSNSTDNKGVVSWIWTFQYYHEDHELDGEMVRFTFEVPGDYVITLTVRDMIGHEGNDTLSIHVRDTMPPELATPEDLEARQGETVRMTAPNAIDNVGIVKWTWTFVEGGETVVLEGEEVEHVFEEAGRYVVTLTLEDAEGNSAQESFTVTVKGSSWVYVGILLLVVAMVLIGYLYLRKKGD